MQRLEPHGKGRILGKKRLSLTPSIEVPLDTRAVEVNDRRSGRIGELVRSIEEDELGKISADRKEHEHELGFFRFGVKPGGQSSG